MIDLKQLRENPARFALGAKAKGVTVDIEALVALDSERRTITSEREKLRAEQNRIAKESGPLIGKLQGQLKAAQGDAKADLERQVDELKNKPQQLKGAIQELEAKEVELQARINVILLQVPLPPDADVPVGSGSDDNVEIRRWNPSWFDASKPFAANKGFEPKTHLELLAMHKLADFDRGVKLAGSRSYILTGLGMRLHQSVLRYAIDFMSDRHGFSQMSVPTLVREETMIGTGFFPAGREQAYQVEESKRGGGYDLFLTGTGEVGLMGVHMDEILDEAQLPLKYVTVSTCYRREAGAAGKDTAGLYRIHQFDKVEQVVICKADEGESRRWHKQMILYVEELLQSLEIPHRLLQCCTGDLGVKNADMVDIESWMPGRGEMDAKGRPTGAYGETHSASRLYDFQCRRLNMRYRPGGAEGKGDTTFCHSLNNTVLASPRVLIPILEMWQNADGSITIPPVLRPYMGGRERIG
ncbi:MAG: serine--tRNA ligase [Phycisphaerales bacterium]